jgi:small subunit ribosomal protein S6e
MQITVQPDVFMRALVGKRIGDTIDGALIGYPGYEFELRGGSDVAGFPMRKAVAGGVKKRILVKHPGPGIRNARIRKGDQIRILVRGNTVTDQIVQVNVVVTKEGKVQLFVEKKEGEEGEEGEEKKPAAKKDDKKKKK